MEQARKIIGIPLQKELKKIDDGSVIVRGLFTSDNKDELGDIITREATARAIPKYRAWGNIRYMHMPRPIGKVIRIGSEDGLEWNEVEIKVIDPQAVFEVEQGLLTALSVGILIKWDDITFDEDGGWIISDYQLAEISLVDHPANYDAKLKDLPVDQGLRVLVRDFGLNTVADSFRSMLEQEMEEMVMGEKDALIAEKMTEILDENPEMSPDEAESKAIASLESGESNSEQISTSIAEDESVEDRSVESEEISLEHVLARLVDVISEFSVTMSSITAQFFLTTEKIDSLLEAAAKVPQAEEQSGSNEGDEKDISLEEDDSKLRVPVNRSGGLPEVDAELEANDNEQVTGLRRALMRYFNLVE